MMTIRVMITVATQFGWQLHQMDVKSAFLNGNLTEEVYMQQPPGYEVKRQQHLVYRLRKALYELTQSHKVWYQKIDEYFRRNGYKKSSSDSNLYVKIRGAQIELITLYVDDLIITRNDATMIAELKKDLKRSFEMLDLGLLHYCLGVQVWQRLGQIFISQTKYTWGILNRF